MTGQKRHWKKEKSSFFLLFEHATSHFHFYWALQTVQLALMGTKWVCEHQALVPVGTSWGRG